MSNEERKALLKAIDRTDSKRLKSKKSAFDYLVKLGTITKTGKPKKPYNVVNV